MKLVIQTQYTENYGSADKPYWKFKGGDTYIVQNLNADQAQRILRDGIPTLKALIQYKNDMSEVYVTDYNIVDDDVVVCEEWETPYILSWENNTWVCRQVSLNDGEFRKPIVSKVVKYTMGMGGEMINPEVSYEIEDGRIVPYNNIMEICQAYEA